MTSKSAKGHLDSLVQWLRGLNEKKVWAVFLAGFFIFYLIRYETAAPLYERIFLSALFALISPPLLFAFFWIPAFFLLYLWVLVEGLLKSLVSWLRK